MGSKRGVPERDFLNRSSLAFIGVPIEYMDADISEYVSNSKKKTLIKNYMQNIHDMYEDTINLCFYGANGSGKTFLASILAREAYKRRYRVLFITMAELIDLTFKSDEQLDEVKRDRLNLVSKADFLVLDEVGKENFTKTGSNINLLEATLRRAATEGQVVILITNMTLENLYKQYGRSIQSLIDGSFVKVEFTEHDYRKEVLKKKESLKLLFAEEAGA